MNANEKLINKKDHPDVYKWLSENIESYENKMEYFTLTSEGKINAYCYVRLVNDITQIKYPFGYVEDDFNCHDCNNLKSLINSPEKVGWSFSCSFCYKLTSFIGFPKYIKGIIDFGYTNFSNDPQYKDQYKLYLAMWLELLESVTNEERLEYIKNYKDKKSRGESIIPIEILKEYGF
jgi:hypothetical protein